MTPPAGGHEPSQPNILMPHLSVSLSVSLCLSVSEFETLLHSQGLGATQLQSRWSLKTLTYLTVWCQSQMDILTSGRVLPVGQTLLPFCRWFRVLMIIGADDAKSCWCLTLVLPPLTPQEPFPLVKYLKAGKHLPSTCSWVTEHLHRETGSHSADGGPSGSA